MSTEKRKPSELMEMLFNDPNVNPTFKEKVAGTEYYLLKYHLDIPDHYAGVTISGEKVLTKQELDYIRSGCNKVVDVDLIDDQTAIDAMYDYETIQDYLNDCEIVPITQDEYNMLIKLNLTDRGDNLYYYIKEIVDRDDDYNDDEDEEDGYDDDEFDDMEPGYGED